MAYHLLWSIGPINDQGQINFALAFLTSPATQATYVFFVLRASNCIDIDRWHALSAQNHHPRCIPIQAVHQ